MTAAAVHLPSATVVEDAPSAFHHSSPHSLRQSFSSPPAPPLNQSIHDYNAAINLRDTDLADDDLTQTSEDDGRISRHSSISSFPASVIQHVPLEEPTTPSRPSPYHGRRDLSTSSYIDHGLTPITGRGYGSAFRNPSSVRAMQMKDDDTESITPKHRRSGSRISTRSHGSAYSAHTSPSKRQSRSNQSSPLKGSKLKKEFPLVLLHCTVLPPASSVIPVNCDNDLYAALLPEDYQRRWNTLQDRLADPELRARGLLIPHPQDDYELLEERLLESLELENPRIRSNHFFRHEKSAGDSGFESASQTGDESDFEATNKTKCPDCGNCLHLTGQRDRKWEIKVYAANGLMRAGAWSAAFREMEKVDVEISLAMPEDVRREVNARLESLKAAQEDVESLPDANPASDLDAWEREIYGSRSNPGAETQPVPPETRAQDQPQTQSMPQHLGHDQHYAQQSYSLHILRDRKNITIALLTLLVLFYAMSGAPKQLNIESASTAARNLAVQEAQTTIVTSTSLLTSTVLVEGLTPLSSSVILPTQSAVTEAHFSDFPEPEAASDPGPAGVMGDHEKLLVEQGNALVVHSEAPQE